MESNNTDNKSKPDKPQGNVSSNVFKEMFNEMSSRKWFKEMFKLMSSNKCFKNKGYYKRGCLKLTKKQ